MIYLLSYSLFMLALVWFIERGHRQTHARFLVADRNVGGWFGAMSIAASWIWAPALFVSTQVGYQWGYSALVWFTLPNMLALVFFGLIAPRVKQRIPEGYSYIESLKGTGGGFRETQLGVQMIMQTVIFALQLTAGAELLSFVTQTSYQNTVLIMTLLPLAYSLLSGLHASVITDAVQYVLMAAAVVFILCGFPYADLPADFTDRLTFAPFDTDMLIQFGISSAVGLFFAIFADHQQWQRIFAVRAGQETRTFITAGFLHFLITFSLGTLGVLVVLYGFDPAKAQLAGPEFIRAHMPGVFIVIFIYMALCGLCSTIDSAFCAFGGLFATEISKSDDKIRMTRLAMIALAVLGFMLAYVRLPIITLWFIASTLRLAAVIPTILSIVMKRYDGLTGTVSIGLGTLIGGGGFMYGIAAGDVWLRTCGMLAALFVSAGLSALFIIVRFCRQIKMD